MKKIAKILLLIILASCFPKTGETPPSRIGAREKEERLSEDSREPLIEEKEASELEPLLKKWLTFYRLDIKTFKLAGTEDFAREAELYSREFDAAVHEKYSPRAREYSPGKRRYINLPEAAFGRSSEGQEIRLVDLDKKKDIMILFAGSGARVEAAFWKNNECFALVYYNSYNEEYGILVYDILRGERKDYRQEAAHSTGGYLERGMSERGFSGK
ncbi:MAG: hypothetical protein LBC67_06505 [Spirochaetales bacterium]|jgi:hypothetical protein|nr:hypothetical protein [Spirochaetales bacterium]